MLGWVVVALLLLVLAALVYLPARWLVPWLQPHLPGVQLDEVSGSLWSGQAGRLLDATGQPLGRLQWQLSRRLLLGRWQVGWQLDDPQWHLHGQALREGADRWRLDDVDLSLPLSVLRGRLPVPAHADGRIELQLAQAELQGGWPITLQGQGRWRDAELQHQGRQVPLGTLEFTLADQAGIVQAQVSDDGRGPLQVRGQGSFSPLGWRVRAQLKARQPQPALQQWLQGLGRADAQGMVTLRRSGGLAAAPSPMDAP